MVTWLTKVTDQKSREASEIVLFYRKLRSIQMIYPNKHIQFEESIIYKMIHILDKRDNGEINIHDLFNKTKKKFKNADEFIYSLDVLYVLE